MQRNSIRSRLYPYSRSLETIGVFGFTAMAFILDYDESRLSYTDWPDGVSDLLKWAQVSSYEILLYLSLFTLVGFYLRLRGDPWLWDKLTFILNGYQAKALPNGAEIPNHQHRVTLFKRKRFACWPRRGAGSIWWPYGQGRWPGSGWLKPVLRSGHTTKNTKAIFLAPDDPSAAEGLAGQSWVGNQVLIRSNLPDLNVENPSNTKIKDFARKTFCTEPMVRFMIRNKKPMPQSLAAIPVEVNGQIWGVVVLDSSDPNGVTHQSVVDFELTVALIGQLLEKA